MDAKRCDRCCEYYVAGKNGASYIEYGQKGTYIGVTGTYKDMKTDVETIDICPTCMKSLKQWISGKETAAIAARKKQEVDNG